jgi:hypothetical protein
MFIVGAFSLSGDFKNAYLKEKRAFVLSFGFIHGKVDGET